jgi:hypothetical protein
VAAAESEDYRHAAFTFGSRTSRICRTSMSAW